MKKIQNFKKSLVLGLVFMFIAQMGNSQSLSDQFFNDVDKILKSHIKNGLVDYLAIKADDRLDKAIDYIADANIEDATKESQIAFYINAYNLNVINQVADNFPISSVINENGFFDKNKIKVAGQEMTLNYLEKNVLLKDYFDARYHFVLVCGALGCPPITDFAYRPDILNQQLEQQTKAAINDPNFLNLKGETLEISQIFKWYAQDFGGSNNAILEFINKYRNEKIGNAKFKFYNYDWSLNDTANRVDNGLPSAEGGSNSSRYIVSSTIPKGSVELKVFNNLYSQTIPSDNGAGERSSFFTTSFSGFYGLSSKFNIGVTGRFRKVRNNSADATAFSVFGADELSNSRAGLTSLGPQIRYAPNPNWPNFSIQSSVVFPIGEDLAGNSERPYIDWNGVTWNTQFFNDFDLGTKFSIFTEVDLLIEDIGALENGHSNRVSTPATVILSYVPTSKLVIYGISGFSPYWQSGFDYFAQVGVGTKYQFTSRHEMELLYTKFTNKFLNQVGGEAQTFNLGFRVNL